MRSATTFQASLFLFSSSVLVCSTPGCNSAGAGPTSTVATTGGTPAAAVPTIAGSTAASAAGGLAPVPATAGTGTAVLPSTAVAGNSAAAGTLAAAPAGTAGTGAPGAAGVTGTSAATAGSVAAAGAPAAGGGGAPAAAGGATWTSVYDGVIVESGCVGGGACHQSAAATSKLGLADPMMAYMQLVNVAAMGMNLPGGTMPPPNCAGTGTMRVKPSDPDNSLLIQKLENKQTCGMAMPPGGMIEADKLSIVRNWIKAGAKMD